MQIDFHNLILRSQFQYVMKAETGSRFTTLWPPSWKSVWRDNSGADGPIWMKFGMPTQNHMPMMTKMSKWKPDVEFQYGGRLFLITGNTNISAVDW